MSNLSLDQVDEIRARTNVSYEKAIEALKKADGDLLQALVLAERGKKESGEGVVSLVGELVDSLTDLAKEGETSKLRVKLGDRVVKEVPLAAGAAAGLILSLAAVLLTRCVIEVVREKG